MNVEIFKLVKKHNAKGNKRYIVYHPKGNLLITCFDENRVRRVVNNIDEAKAFIEEVNDGY